MLLCAATMLGSWSGLSGNCYVVALMAKSPLNHLCNILVFSYVNVLGESSVCLIQTAQLTWSDWPHWSHWERTVRRIQAGGRFPWWGSCPVPEPGAIALLQWFCPTFHGTIWKKASTDDGSQSAVNQILVSSSIWSISIDLMQPWMLENAEAGFLKGSFWHADIINPIFSTFYTKSLSRFCEKALLKCCNSVKRGLQRWHLIFRKK